MTEDAYERLRAALQRHGSKAEAAGPDRFMAQCPAHEDGRPSLSVRRGDRCALVYCFAGCDTPAILDALGLSLRDLYDADKISYTYGDDLRSFVVTRTTATKDFRQSGHTRGWKGGKPLYRLPAVVTAVQVGAPVWFTEGEKDADLIAAAGGFATTNAGGADNAHTADFSPLSGAHVRVLSDLDAAGAKHRASVIRLAEKAGAASVTVWTVKAGKDYADHHAAGYGLDDLDQADIEPDAAADHRQVVLIAAADITPEPTTWTWAGRMPTGALCLIAGPEGTGKTTVGYWLAARVTRGQLPGVHAGVSRDVLIAATEDSWARTIVPRLIAAGADLTRVWRVEVVTALGTGGYLTLPKDVGSLARHVRDKSAALLLLDPIMSRLDASLDTHRDAETRQALEPIAALADNTGLCIVGLIHFNKGGSSEVLNNVMASKAFTAVSRSVSTVIRDPNDDTGLRRIFATPKSNLGRDDLPLMPFTIAGHTFTHAGHTIETSKVEWQAEEVGNVADLMRQAREDKSDRTVVGEVSDWLADWLETEGGEATKKDITAAAKKEGYNETHLRRARERLRLDVDSRGFPRRTWWSIPTAETAEKSGERQSGHSRVTPGESDLTDLTDLTGVQSGQSGQSGQSRESDPTVTRLASDDSARPRCTRCHSTFGVDPGAQLCGNCETDQWRQTNQRNEDIA